MEESLLLQVASNISMFDKTITWGLHEETLTAKAYRTFIRRHFLFKIEQSITRFKLTFHKLLIRSVITYACPVCEFATNTPWMT
jgi:hypothetical protein